MVCSSFVCLFCFVLFYLINFFFYLFVFSMTNTVPGVQSAAEAAIMVSCGTDAATVLRMKEIKLYTCLNTWAPL